MPTLYQPIITPVLKLRPKISCAADMLLNNIGRVNYYLEVVIDHKIKAQQVKVAHSTMKLLTNTLKTHQHDLLHTFLEIKKREKRTSKRTEREGSEGTKE